MSLLGKLSGFDQARGYVTLLAVAAAAAGLYAWGALAHADARALERQAELICGVAGSQFVAAPPKPGAHARKADRGKACLERVRVLATFERETNTGTAEVLTSAMRDRNRKTQLDAQRAAGDAAATRAALERMEAQDAAIQSDKVGADWFGAVNHLAGLRDDGR